MTAVSASSTDNLSACVDAMSPVDSEDRVGQAPTALKVPRIKLRGRPPCQLHRVAQC